MIQEINSFLCIVKTGSLSKAADLLFITQPTLTHRINLLERNLGYSLLIRGPGIRKVELTPQGQQFFELAEQMSHLWNRAEEIQSEHIVERYRISGIESINLFLLDAVCQKFMEAHPHVQLSLKNQYSDLAYQDVDTYCSDLGIITNTQHSKNIITQPAFQEEMVLICSSTYNLPDTVDLLTLDPRHNILVPWSTSFELWYQYWFSSHSSCKIYIQNAALLKKFLMTENSWSIVPAIVGNRLCEESNITIRPIINGPDPRITYFLTRRASSSPYTAILMEAVRSELSGQPGITLLY